MVRVAELRRNEKVLCVRCNTRQAVPPEAVSVSEETRPAAPAPGPEPERGPSPPEYGLVKMIGVIFLVIATCMAAVIVVLSLRDTPQSLLVLLNLTGPLTIVAFVLLLFMIRDIAIHNWHIRRNSSR
jgi:hypothetical protein